MSAYPLPQHGRQTSVQVERAHGSARAHTSPRTRFSSRGTGLNFLNFQRRGGRGQARAKVTRMVVFCGTIGTLSAPPAARGFSESRFTRASTMPCRYTRQEAQDQ